MSKFCQSCGAELDDNARFCEKCGAKTIPRGFAVDSTEKYHWYYEMNMFTSPTLLITLYKVFGGIVIGCGLGLGLILWASSGKLSTAWGVMKGFGVAGIVILVLVSVAYLIYAAVQGGKYCVLFEMDDAGVTHTQLAKQFKKAQVIAGLTLLMGAVKGSMTMMGTGLLAGSRSSMRTSFKGVRQIKVNRRRKVIYLRCGLEHNQVYVQRENFDEVLQFILARIPKDVKRKGVA